MEKIGYACINMSLTDNGIKINRGMVRKTFEKKGLPYVSELIISNLKDMLEIIEWNEKNNIRNYRMSSDMFPWFSKYKISDLPKFEIISDLMNRIGSMAKKYKHKLSFHPGFYNCLASLNTDVVENTMYELEQHSILMYMMGLEATPFYNINIHVGGIYGNKQDTMDRFIVNYGNLSENLRKRLTLENDDSAGSYTVKDLYYIYEKTGIPIVFDTLHYELNKGDMNYDDSFKMAYSTWGNVVPEIHHSSSKKIWEDITKPSKSHADYIYEECNTCGVDVYITIESKAKDLAVLKYREDYMKG